MRHPEAPSISGQYLLSAGMEEAGEFIQIAGKIGRHGWSSFSPADHDRTSNRELLAQEAGDLIGAIRTLVRHGYIDGDIVERYACSREDKLDRICPIDELCYSPDEFEDTEERPFIPRPKRVVPEPTPLDVHAKAALERRRRSEP